MGRTDQHDHLPAHDEPITDVPTVFVLFGATGDLAKRMVLPAFYRLAQEDLLPSNWLLVGNGRGDVGHEDFRDRVHDSLTEFGPKPEGAIWDAFRERLLFAGGGFEKHDPGSLLVVLDDARKRLRAGDAPVQLVHYLAIPPTTFLETTEALGHHNLVANARVVYEKPFGTSPEGFLQLSAVVESVLDEQQVYRIDHFLGKEATQQLHVLRFANGMFGGVWNREHVRAVQIDVPEQLGIDDRAVFYDQTGAVRDMLVTHLFQVAAEVAMEPPLSLSAEDLQDARESVIDAFRPLDPAEVVLGQFDGYLDVEGIADGSKTDTFVAARLWIDTDRWRDVPFLLRTGKCMAANAEQVSLVLRPSEDGVFGEGHVLGDVADNVLTFSLSGDGAVEITMTVKRPGVGLELTSTTMKLTLDDIAGGDPLPPYARLIHDVVLGDRSLFTRPDGLENAWNAIKPILNPSKPPESYAPGSWGPERANLLAEPDGWILEGVR